MENTELFTRDKLQKLILPLVVEQLLPERAIFNVIRLKGNKWEGKAVVK